MLIIEVSLFIVGAIAGVICIILIFKSSGNASVNGFKNGKNQSKDDSMIELQEGNLPKNTMLDESKEK